jgi:hypothetical protein
MIESQVEPRTCADNLGHQDRTLFGPMFSLVNSNVCTPGPTSKTHWVVYGVRDSLSVTLTDTQVSLLTTVSTPSCEIPLPGPVAPL